MKYNFYVVITVVAVLTMLITGVAAAQLASGGETPRPERDLEQHDSKETQEVPDTHFAPMAPFSKAMSMRERRINAPAVALGKPGFNFRIDRTFGVTMEPYPADTAHINGPEGLFVDSSNNVYVAEGEGSRVLRYTSSGTNNLVIGTAGWWDTYDEYLSWPADVYVDSTGDIWVVDGSRVARFSSTGSLEMSFPANEDERNDCLSDNSHFCNPQGIAFDSSGQLFVSDTDNHRIQVFTIFGGTPVYVTTIGTGSAGSGNDQFYYPGHIALNSANQLFVADSGNHRVQKCTFGPPWTCVTFHGITGSWGEDLDRLDFPRGVTVDPAGNVFVADTNNWRVKKCTPGGSCNHFADPNSPEDVALDTDGNLYAASWYNSYTINKYNSSGGFISYFAGTNGLAYVGDTTHIYVPHAIGVDPNGDIYVAERMGNRWLKINKNGTRVWSKGTPGMRLNDSEHFGDNIYGNPAVSVSNLLYLPAGNQRCVRIYDLNGNYQNATIGTCQGATGDDGTLLGNVSGVAISPLNGKIYVVDRGYCKVKVYDSGRSYLGYIGQGLGPTGLGNGNYQFDEPMGIAVDTDGNIYVADRNNHRVQKYNNSGIFQYSIGVTDYCDWAYGYLCRPSGVALDEQNRVYIAENWNNRITIFDTTGAYLSTIGGQWGTILGRFNGPAGVAVAADGTVYVTEQYNHQVQVFKRGVSGWAQDNLNGFGYPDAGVVLALEPFAGSMYAAAYSYLDEDQIYKRTGTSWTELATTGIGHGTDWNIIDLTVFKDQLYAGTWTEDYGGEVLRSSDGVTWEQVNEPGFGDAEINEVDNLTVFDGFIYATSYVDNISRGAQVWRTDTGESDDWDLVVPNGFGDPNNIWVASAQVYNAALFVATENYNRNLEEPGIAELWSCVDCDGTDWIEVTLNWTNISYNSAILDMEVFDSRLYAYTVNQGSQGGEIWRCQLCDGTDWEQVVNDGLGDPYRDGHGFLKAHQDALFWGIRNYRDTGMEVWKTTDGEEWIQVGFNGFGDPNNVRAWIPNAVSADGNDLYVGTDNWANGGEIWVYLENDIYLPAIRH